MNLGPLELLLLMIGALSLLGPVIAGVYLATRLNKPGGESRPDLR
jgi:hypothetical protein